MKHSHPSPKLLKEDGSVGPMIGEEAEESIDIFVYLAEALFSYVKNHKVDESDDSSFQKMQWVAKLLKFWVAQVLIKTNWTLQLCT